MTLDELVNLYLAWTSAAYRHSRAIDAALRLG